MKVQNMKNANGNKVANQFEITNDSFIEFQSYTSSIARKYHTGQVELDSKYWDYSKTTGRYRNQFLGETKAETQKKIDAGIYILTDLNR